MTRFQYDASAAALLALALGPVECKNKVRSYLEHLWDSVVNGRMSSRLLEEALDGLLTKQALATSQEERAALNAAIVALVHGTRKQGDSPLAPASTVTLATPVQTPSMPKGSPFYGLGLKEAAPKQLQLYGKPQTPRDIWEVLHSTGFQTAHGDPVGAVHSALRRRAKTHGDVLLVGGGQWGRKEWYSEAQLEEIRKSVGGMGGRDKVAHSAATTRGMLVARSRGARLGAVNKLGPEKAAELLDMARSGATVAKIAEKFEISTASVNNYLRRSGHSMRELKREGKLRASGPADEPPSETEPGETRH